jgi:uncharacterized DUF497 family protein
MVLSWDEAKRAANIRKHGVDLQRPPRSTGTGR